MSHSDLCDTIRVTSTLLELAYIPLLHFEASSRAVVASNYCIDGSWWLVSPSISKIIVWQLDSLRLTNPKGNSSIVGFAEIVLHWCCGGVHLK